MTTGTALPNFTKRLDQTAEDTEALLAKLLSDKSFASRASVSSAVWSSCLAKSERVVPVVIKNSSKDSFKSKLAGQSVMASASSIPGPGRMTP